VPVTVSRERSTRGRFRTGGRGPSVALEQHGDALTAADAEADKSQLWSLRSISPRILVVMIAPVAAIAWPCSMLLRLG
jgi:hypothetical protein